MVGTPSVVFMGVAFQRFLHDTDRIRELKAQLEDKVVDDGRDDEAHETAHRYQPSHP